MYRFILLILSLFFILTGCSGVQTFPNMARAGDTVSVGMGWQKEFRRSNTTVTITPSVGQPVVYLPNDPALRAIFNLYPDPVSWLVVGTDTKTDFINDYGNTYGSFINRAFTDGDHDWWQTTAFVDLPDSLPLGETLVEFTNDSGDIFRISVEVIEGGGSSDDFDAMFNGPLDVSQLGSLARSSHFEVSFSGDEVPYAIELLFTSGGGLHVINPRSSVKNIIWSGEPGNSQLKIMLVPAKLGFLENFNDFKFYIAGYGAQAYFQDIQPLELQSLQAFDMNGNEILGINVSISSNIE